MKWRILHPSGSHYLFMDSFKEAMDKWFEGFNIPVRIYFGKFKEPFWIAHRRVSQYLQRRKS